MKKQNCEKWHLSPVQLDLTTLEQAWLSYLPGRPAPTLPQVCAWLRVVSVEKIIEQIEFAAQHSHIRNPAGWLQTRLMGGGSHAN